MHKAYKFKNIYRRNKVWKHSFQDPSRILSSGVPIKTLTPKYYLFFILFHILLRFNILLIVEVTEMGMDSSSKSVYLQGGQNSNHKT